MTVAGLVMDTIRLRRAYDCERDRAHAWSPVAPGQGPSLGPDEEQCKNCGIIATPEGKKKLAAAARSFHGYARRDDEGNQGGG